MADAAPMGSMEPTQDDRTMAILAHVLQLVGWWIAPLIILLIKREARFVSFHALQALLLRIVYAVLFAVCMILFFSSFFLTVANNPHPQNAQPPPAFFLLFPLIWLGFVGGWAVMLVIAIVYGIKAGRGEWAEYPVLGALARRFLKIGPGGVPLTS